MSTHRADHARSLPSEAMPTRRDLLLLALVACGGVLAALLATVGGVDTALLQIAPALVLFVPLLAGRYVGEDRLVAAIAAFVPRRARAAARLVPRLPRAPRHAAPRGGRLLAAALAHRGPPGAALAR